MIRYYSLFVTDDKLLTSPYINQSNISHDVVVHRGQVETVNFLLQTPLSKEQKDSLTVKHDSLALTVNNFKVKVFSHQTLVTVNLIAKEIGVTKIGFSFSKAEKPLGFHQKTVSLSKINKIKNRINNTARMF